MEREKPETASEQLGDTAQDVRPPVFVVETGDGSLYGSLADAIRSIEGVDVADGLYRLFDSPRTKNLSLRRRRSP